MQKKLSIIIPIYNGERYLRRCLDSVLQQRNLDMHTVEMLLLNDGSKDSSLKILKQYAKKYPGIIKIIDQPNMGAARTRNNGIAAATAPYTMFLDQDDWIDPDYCRIFFDAISNGQYDVVYGGFRLVDEFGKMTGQRLPGSTEFDKFLFIPAWAKIHRSQFLKQHKIEFFENNIGEDNVFTAKEIATTEKYVGIAYVGYNNSFQNSGNVTNSLHKGLSKEVNFTRLLQAIVELEPLRPGVKAMMKYNVLRTIAYYLFSYGRNATPKRFIEVNDEIFNWLHTNVPDFSRRACLPFGPKGENAKASLSVAALLLMNRVRLVPLFAKIYCKGKNE